MIIFLIPVYNEEENIEVLFKKLEEAMSQNSFKYQIIIVNDGSSDNSRELVESFKDKMPIELINHETNKGPGETFKTGFMKVLYVAKDDDVIITKEADNTSDLSILGKMIKGICEGNDLVLASCYAKGGGIVGTTLLRRILSNGANLLLKFVFPIRGVNTYSSFYRAYTGNILRKAYLIYGSNFIREKGFAWAVETLIKLSRLPIKIVEVPMVLRTNLRKGKSKIKVIKTIIGYLRLVIKNLFH